MTATAMRDFRVKLISLPNLYFLLRFSQCVLPHDLGVINAFLRDSGYDVSMDDMSVKIESYNRRFRFSPGRRIDLTILRQEQRIIDYLSGHSCDKKVEQFSDNLAKVVSCEGYDLIGISVKGIFQFLFALLLSKKIKSLSDAKIVLGGPSVTIHGRELFNKFPYLDYMITGDGQVPLFKLVNYLEGRAAIEDVPNLIYRQNGTVKSNPRKLYPIEDLCMPDFPDYMVDFYRSRYYPALVLPYQISRGCPYECSFCDHKHINPSVEFKSYDKVVREIKAMKERYQSNRFFFYDEVINCSYEYLDKLCDIFIEEKLDISWSSAARSDNLDRKILQKMKKAGCVSLGFGIESGSNRILKIMGKGFTSEQAARVLKDSYDEGIRNILFIIVGYPHEKKEDITETIEFIRKNAQYIDTIAPIRPLVVVYGSLLYNNPEKFGIDKLRPKFDMFSYFVFDEINGLRWEEKVKQQKYSYKKILWANFKYILSKKYRINLIHFWLYFWLRDKKLLVL